MPGLWRRLAGGASASGRLGLCVIGAICLVSAAAGLIAPGDPFATSAAVLQPPSRNLLFGSDDLGRDLFRAIVHGSRVSLLVAFVTTAAGLAIGVLVGATAGLFGGLTDDGLMRLTEVVQVMPRFFVVLAVAAVFGSSLEALLLVLGLTSWTGIARLTRSQVLSIRTFDHVIAARAAGASSGRVLIAHVLPLTLAPVIALASFQASGAILIEAGVSFLGLGDPSVMTWGVLLHEGQHSLRAAWWLAFFPGAALTVTVLGIHLVADAISDRAALPGWEG